MEDIKKFIHSLRTKCLEAHLKSMFQSNDFMYAYTDGYNDALDEIENHLNELNLPFKVKKVFTKF